MYRLQPEKPFTRRWPEAVEKTSVSGSAWSPCGTSRALPSACFQLVSSQLVSSSSCVAAGLNGSAAGAAESGWVGMAQAARSAANVSEQKDVRTRAMRGARSGATDGMDMASFLFKLAKA